MFIVQTQDVAYFAVHSESEIYNLILQPTVRFMQNTPIKYQYTCSLKVILENLILSSPIFCFYLFFYSYKIMTCKYI